MVTISNRNRDRGQLLLVGAITLAFVILGAVVVYNGVLATETLSSGPTAQSGSDANVTNEELEDGIRGITHRGNIYWNETGDYNETLQNVTEGNESIPGYTQAYQNTTANNRPAITEIDNVTVDTKARVATNKITNLNLSLTTRQIGHLTIEFDENSEGDLKIDTENGSKEFNYNSGEYYVGGCSIKKPPARVDLVSGEVNGTDQGCDLALIDPSESYDELNFSNGSGVSGSYELVVKGDQDIGDISDVDYGAWEVFADITYTSSYISYTRSVQIPIYERER